MKIWTHGNLTNAGAYKTYSFWSSSSKCIWKSDAATVKLWTADARRSAKNSVLATWKRRRQHRIKLCCLVELPIKDQEEELIYSHLYKPRFTNMQRRWLKMMGPHRIRCCALWARVANECFFREPTATQSSASESSRRSPTKRWGGAVCWTDLRATRPEFPLPPRGTGK